MLFVGIDAGHGGEHDRGASTPHGSVWEKDLTLEVARKVAAMPIHGVNVAALRVADIDQSFRTRRAAADRQTADLVISVHFDSFPSRPAFHGLCIYYPRGGGIEKAVGSTIMNHAPLRLRGGRTYCAHNEDGRTDDDWLQRPQNVLDAFTKDSKRRALLVECGYLSNPEDRAFILNPRGTEMIALAIAQGISHYALIMKGRT